MSTFSLIQKKLESFIRKYYTNELIKGVLLFLAIGLLYLLLTLLVEYFLWLNSAGRRLLFWLVIAVEGVLFVRFIAFPLLKLFKLQHGIGHVEASKIIGNHFPEVSDRLLNVIQLNQNQRQSELLAASIDQKASELQPIPFQRAVNFKTNAKYLKYLAIPVVVFIIFSLWGDGDLFRSSYERVVNYDTAYEPPAPFVFTVTNDRLTAIENKPFTLTVQTEGEVVPEQVSIQFEQERYYLQPVAPGVFEYTFLQPEDEVSFQLNANGVTSVPYTLTVIKTPSLVGFELWLDYPSHTGIRDEALANTGNATIPEGTMVTWQVTANNTETVHIKTADSAYAMTGEESDFRFDKRIYRNLDYSITTSNQDLQDYENLAFTLGVIKDQYPDIDLSSKIDSLDATTTYFLGEVSDDYGLTKLQLVYYPIENPEVKERLPLPVNTTTVDQFVCAFPSELKLSEGTSYEYYFEVFDNDAIHGNKSSKSGVYTYRKLTKEEEEQQQLENQEESIEGMDNTLQKMKDQENALRELSNLQKEKKELNWNDKKKLENFIKRQQQQEGMMKKFSKELQKNLEQFQPEEEKDPFKEQLEERLKENEEQLEENEKLLEELQRLQEKIQKEELTEKLENLAKQNKNQERNLEQLLELTKRYYVTKKAEKLAEEMYKLGEEQEALSEKEESENTKEAQERLNEKFDTLKEEMKSLQKENKALKEPMKLPDNAEKQQEVSDEQRQATQKLDQKDSKGAQKNQKKAGQKMKQMGQQMQSSMSAGQMETIQEDVEMLRQILDNLVVFSLEQEALMDTFKEIDYGSATFGSKLNVQNDLKLNFQHIDDSLFALSLRQPMISTTINESLTETQYNLDKSLERLAENQLRQGLANQQYVITGSNELAVILSDLLGNMQNQMMQAAGMGSGQGQGQGQGFQLPDIIQQQQSLSEKMKEGMGQKSGKQGQGQEGEGEGQGQGEGQGNGQGEGQGQGNNGKGSQGNEGNGGNDGQGQEGSEDSNEDLNGKLYEIYKEQQQLRQQLEDKLSREGLKGTGGDILRKMEQVEDQLLDKGFNNRTLEQMLNLQYELLKLDTADFEQGQESRRESNTNRRTYNNTLRMQPDEIKKYFNSTEILNREALPLRPVFKQRVQSYFRRNND
ncbi:DUF4175 family protein [Altibacter sp. HG106]|uniref:DUF4175 family protein n=1 Tax=Altibacter sp. HG106 TaxID=3023937 RepID=UPI00234FBC37|nr:DUF4175 family protein [Altibacter sp. HG106]MDC7994985.1 hypothetical protein [Altibacter sp. HG106]